MRPLARGESYRKQALMRPGPVWEVPGVLSPFDLIATATPIFSMPSASHLSFMHVNATDAPMGRALSAPL